MTYVDGFLAAVPTAKRDEYTAFSEKMNGLMLEFGALSATDCWGDDVPDGEVTSFPMAVKCGDDETVCFGWVVWPDKATRDAGFKKMMEDPRCQPDVAPMPFDGKRMIYGGFAPIVEA